MSATVIYPKIPPKYPPDNDCAHSDLWKAFVANYFPKLWEDYHGRPVFLPGETVGVFGPTNSSDAIVWYRWEEEFLPRIERVDQSSVEKKDPDGETGETKGCFFPIIEGLVMSTSSYFNCNLLVDCYSDFFIPKLTQAKSLVDSLIHIDSPID